MHWPATICRRGPPRSTRRCRLLPLSSAARRRYRPPTRSAARSRSAGLSAALVSMPSRWRRWLPRWRRRPTSCTWSPRVMKRAQNGFTMVEMLVALLIGLFLLGGLLTLVQDNKRTFMAQGNLSQLQDSERLAMTMMPDVIQATGYFPNPTLNTAASVLLAAGSPSGALAQGQAMIGTYSAVAPADTITARYATANRAGIRNCPGASNTSGGTATYSNAFSVVVNAAGVSQLVCTMNGTQYPLVSGVTQLAVMYGVNTIGSGSNVDTYMNAVQVTAGGNWNNVMSVQITLTFTNPLYTAPGLGQLPTLSFQRNVAVMGATGI